MKKLLKFLLITVTAVVVLAIAAVIAASILINPNDYKGDIVKVVKTETGRDLKLQGDIKLSFFPWLGLELGKTQFSNAPGFGRKPMASIDRVELKLQLLPLLRKQVEVKTIVLDGLELNLAKNKQGVTNWDDIVARTAAKPGTAAPKKTPATKAAAPLAAFTIGGVDIRRAQLHWVDASSGTDAHVRNLHLQTSKLASATPMSIKLGFDLETGKPVIRTPFDMQGKVTIDPDRQTLKVEHLQLSLLELDMVADVTGEKIIDAPQLSGKFSLKPANLRSVLKQLGIKVEMHDKALQSVSLDTDFAFNQGTGAVGVTNLVFKLDDSTLKGKASYTMSTVPAIRADIAIDTIDADLYLPQSRAAKQGGGSSSEGKAAGLVIPVKPLRTLDLQANFSLASLKLMGIRTEKINIPIKAKGGLVNIGPSHAQMYGGKYVGSQSLDVRKGAPRLSSTEKLTGVQLGDLLKDAEIFDKFSGVGNVTADITARGIDVDDILNTLNGKAAVSLKNGRVKGVNLHKMVNDAKDAYNKAKGKPVEAHPKVSDETEYANLTASATVKNGIVTSKDLKMDGPFTKVTGAGTVNLPKSSMDYHAQVLISENKNDPPVPVRIHGSFSNLHFSIEWNKILQDRARKEVQKRVEEEKKKAQEQIKKDLENKLKDLFKR